MPQNNNAHILIEQQRLLQETLNGFVDIMGVEARNHFVKSFKDQGFTDTSLEPWEARKDEEAFTGSLDFRKSRSGFLNTEEGNRAILVKSGDLKRSIKVLSKTQDSVTLGSDLPYAQIHNEGGNGLAFGKHPFKMPKREFMGDSAMLITKLKKMLQNRLAKIFK